MSSSGPIGDPRTGRNRRIPTRVRTFKHGTLDPVTEHRRPLLTWGNAILVAVMVGFGLYATGNFPQLDTFFDTLDKQARSRNDIVVHFFITYGPYLFGAIILAVLCLFVFLFINNRHRLSESKGPHKVTGALLRHRSRSRIRRANLPSMVMPLGKKRPARRAGDSPAQAPAAPDTGKAAAIAAAARAEATLAATPAKRPSFVMPLGKTRKPRTPSSPLEVARIAATPDPSTLAAIAAAAKAKAAILAAKAATAKAAAEIATAKAEAAVEKAAEAAAKAEAATLTTAN